MKFTHLTFDCYGTLIDWRKGIEAYLDELLRRSGAPSSPDLFSLYVKLEAEEEGQYQPYRDVLRNTAVRVARHLNVSISEREATTFAGSVPSWPPFSDTADTLKELGRRGYKRVILSNIDRDILEKTILHNGLEVDAYITAEDVGSYKPSVGHWNRFFELHKASKETTLHVAQSIFHDIIPSIRLGVPTAWINRYSESKQPQVSPSYVLGDLRGLLKLLT